jgi:hypothetical protein
LPKLNFVCDNCGHTILVKAIKSVDYYDFDVDGDAGQGYWIEEGDVADSEGMDDYPTFYCEHCMNPIFEGSDDDFIEWLMDEGLLTEE